MITAWLYTLAYHSQHVGCGNHRKTPGCEPLQESIHWCQNKRTVNLVVNDLGQIIPPERLEPPSTITASQYRKI
jgi:hypothetical protein